MIPGISFGMYVRFKSLFAYLMRSTAPGALQDSVEADIRAITPQMLHGQVDVP
jgi:hypothetical protein